MKCPPLYAVNHNIKITCRLNTLLAKPNLFLLSFSLHSVSLSIDHFWHCSRMSFLTTCEQCPKGSYFKKFYYHIWRCTNDDMLLLEWIENKFWKLFRFYSRKSSSPKGFQFFLFLALTTQYSLTAILTKIQSKICGS